jgi:hypothetical protein
MLSNLPLQEQETSVKGTQTHTDTRKELTPNEVRVGYRTEMSHKERQKWLKTRTYSQSKPLHIPA